MSVRLFVAAACVIAASVVLARAERQEIPRPRNPLAQLPVRVGQWDGRTEPALEPNIVKVLGVDDYTLRSYHRAFDRARVGLYVGFHEEQRHGDSIHSPLNCMPGAGWVPIDRQRLQIEVPSKSGQPRRIEVNRVVIERGIDRTLVLYWYQSHGRVVASEYWGKVYTVLDAIRLNRTDASLVRITVPFRPDAPDGLPKATSAASEFVRVLLPVLNQYLPD